MRIKRFKNPYIDEIALFNQVISNEENFISRKASFLYPVILDIGCGNGEVLSDLALKNPNKFYLGFELQYKEVYRSAQKIKKLNLSNCYVARIDAKTIPDLFARGEIEQVNIFFPDPWPKTRQKKNRLINKKYMAQLCSKMTKGSSINIKTDNDDYFLQMLKVTHDLASEGILEITYLTRDYHNSDFRGKEYITPFERIFLRQGFLINYITCRIK
ncbi:MAG: tRNA (guanosine(46)-N7)-methyltransferase TrmB [bacterium]